MCRLWLVLLLAAGCDYASTWPMPTPLGEQQLPGYEVLPGHPPGIDARFDGFLVASDKPGQFSIAWIESSGGSDVFDGTVAVDGALDRASTFAHTGQEMLAFDSDRQVSFRSMPGGSLHGIDVGAPGGVIYLDARINGSHVGVSIEFIVSSTLRYYGGTQWGSTVDPVAFESRAAQ